MSVQHGQVGNFKVLDLLDIAWQQVGNLQCQCSMGRLATLKCWILLDSAVLEDGQVQLEPVQIGVAGQPLASELGWFDECSWLLWQICKVAR